MEKQGLEVLAQKQLGLQAAQQYSKIIINCLCSRKLLHAFMIRRSKRLLERQVGFVDLCW